MEQRNQPSPFLKYSSLAIQMGAIIGLSAWGGQKLDAYYNNSKPLITVALSLAGIGASLYLVFRDMMKPGKHSK